MKYKDDVVIVYAHSLYASAAIRNSSILNSKAGSLKKWNQVAWRLSLINSDEALSIHPLAPGIDTHPDRCTENQRKRNNILDGKKGCAYALLSRIATRAFSASSAGTFSMPCAGACRFGNLRHNFVFGFAMRLKVAIGTYISTA
jgi:hypothetical protein